MQPGLHAFGTDVQLASDYVFGEIVPMFQVLSADAPPIQLVCVSFQLTPRLTNPLDEVFSFVPLGIALLVGFATLFAAVYNPWTGTTDLLRATSNFGMDPDALRLVTPGFIDVIYYIQFAVYTACLSLDYPGFYQPVLSRVAWSNLLFNTTLLNNGTASWSTTTDSLYGVYDNSTASFINVVNGSDYGLTQYADLVGITAKNVWPTFIIWWLLVLCAIIILTELCFTIYWAYRYISGKHTTDFAALNICFLGGMIIRVWALFYVCLVTLCCYQFVVAGVTPTYTVALSAVVFVLLGVATPMGLVYIISRYRPPDLLYDDLHILLVIGPLYNIYDQPKYLFVGVVYFLRLVQGIVIGAAQTSGITQITILALLEVSFLCAVNIWRPYPTRTSMNGWHTFMSVVRLIIVLFLVAFIPSLAVEAGIRAWIGYTLLVLHAAVLIFVFVINVILTIVEVSARMAGAGEDSTRREREFGLVNVFGINQLMKRNNSTTRPIDMEYVGDAHGRKPTDLRPNRLSRNSSQGGSSYGLMDTSASYMSTGSTPGGTPLSPYGDRRNTMSPILASPVGGGYFSQRTQSPTTMYSPAPTAPTPASFTSDPRTSAYYRQPRRSHGGITPISPGATRFDPQTERANLDTAIRTAFAESIDVPPRSISRTGSPRPGSSSDQQSSQPRPDYAVREADAFYYRRPDYSAPLNPDPTARRLGTGPADPTGPISMASSWLRGVFRRNPEKGKFEVVRGNAARTEIPLTENTGSRPSTAGKGESVRSPLVESNMRIVEDEQEDEGLSDEIISTPKVPPVIPELDMGPPALRKPLEEEEDDDFILPLPPPKNPNRGSLSSFEEIPPSLPQKSSARASPSPSPRVPGEIPWGDERVQQVKTGRAVWTQQPNEGSKESVGEVGDSVGEWSDEE